MVTPSCPAAYPPFCPALPCPVKQPALDPSLPSPALPNHPPFQCPPMCPDDHNVTCPAQTPYHGRLPSTCSPATCASCCPLCHQPRRSHWTRSCQVGKARAVRHMHRGRTGMQSRHAFWESSCLCHLCFLPRISSHLISSPCYHATADSRPSWPSRVPSLRFSTPEVSPSTHASRISTHASPTRNAPPQ